MSAADQFTPPSTHGSAALLLYYEGHLVDTETRWARKGMELILFSDHPALARGMVLQVRTTADDPLQSALVQSTAPAGTILRLEASASSSVTAPRAEGPRPAPDLPGKLR